MATTPVTRATLIQRVATRANTSGYADTSLGGEVSQLVDLSLAKIHNILVGLYEDYFTKKFYINIVNGQDTYTLPPDFMKSRTVFYVDVPNNGYRWPIPRINLQDVLGRPLSGSFPNVILGYLLMGNSLIVEPRPTAPQNAQLLMYYIPEYAPALNDNTPIEYAIAFGWDEWVVNDVCVQIRNKAMMPHEELVQERLKIETDIRHQAKQRNAGDPARVRDNGWNGMNPFNRFGNFAIKG